MANDINTALDALVSLMQGLDFPNVYAVLPLMPTGVLLKEQFTVPNDGDPYLAGWTVTWRTAQPRNEENLGEWGCVIAVEGWLGYDGEDGQRQMNDWLQALLPELWTYATLNGTVQDVMNCQVTNNEPRIAFDVLCHYARIEMTALLVFGGE